MPGFAENIYHISARFTLVWKIWNESFDNCPDDYKINLLHFARIKKIWSSMNPTSLFHRMVRKRSLCISFIQKITWMLICVVFFSRRPQKKKEKNASWWYSLRDFGCKIPERHSINHILRRLVVSTWNQNITNEFNSDDSKEIYFHNKANAHLINIQLPNKQFFPLFHKSPIQFHVTQK